MPTKSPDVIYRYQPMRPDAVDLILTGRLWFSDPSRFNDPFDILPTFSDGANRAIERAAEEAYWTNPSIRGSRSSFLEHVKDKKRD